MAQQAAQAAQAPATFALSPALAISAQFIDYSTRTGMLIFTQATEKLSIQFEVEEDSVQTFIELLRDRAAMSGWNEDAVSPITKCNNFNLLTEFGRIKLADLKADVANYIDQNTRKAQNSYQMYLCITNSLTEAGRAKILTETDQFTVNGIPSGPLLFKLLMTRAATDTRATVTYIRTAMSKLDEYMKTIDSDIEKFNLYVRKLRQNLSARGETSNDLLVNLFKGYASASDESFTRYIQRKKDAYDEGDNVTEETLMKDAINKFQNLKLEGKWNALSADQEKLVALQAEFKVLKDKNLKLTPNLSGDNKNNNYSDSKKANTNKKSKNKRKNQNAASWAWKKVPPKENEPKTIQKDKKTYHWCPDHNAWTVHSHEKCELRIKRMQKEKEESSNNETKNNETSKAATYAAILNLE